jgi:hypothetical protein
MSVRTLSGLGVVAMAGLSVLACSSSEDTTSGASGGSSGDGGTGSGATGSGGTSGAGAGSGATSSGGQSGGGGASGASTGGGSNTGGSSAGYDCGNPAANWLFCEDFEGMAQGFDSWKAGWGWTEHIGADNPGRMTASKEAHSGSWAVHYPADASAGYQGADLMYRTCSGANKAGCALTQHDQLYFRTYLKLAADHERVHHFLSIGGSQNYWDAYGNAGCRPNGYRHMGSTVDFDANTHETFFYTYFPGMKCDSGAICDKYADSQSICSGCAQKDMACESGPECCWGNGFRPTPAVALPTNKWICFEMMVKANDVGQANGEMAYWIDGQLAHQETTMQWRTTQDLGLNMVRLQHYVTTSDAKSHSNQVWFDDVVVSTQPIGCL